MDMASHQMIIRYFSCLPAAVFTAYIRPIYQIKADKMLHSIQKELDQYDKCLHLWITLSLFTCPNFAEKLGKCSENPGEIPHV